MTEIYGVIGDPIAHSLSPLIHKGWMRDHGINGEYLALQVPAGELKEALETLAHRGLKGTNITLPHKIKALELSAWATPRAKTIGAVNTLWQAGDGKWHGDNTDAPGFVAALTGILEDSLRGQNVLVLGAGGAAKAVVYALDQEGATITIANRTPIKAKPLLDAYPKIKGPILPLEDINKKAAHFDIVINTTSLGHTGNSLPLPPGEGALLYDISYGKAADIVLHTAAANGWRVADGLSMLVYQGAFAFERWFGILPSIDKGLERARNVLEMA